MCLWLEFFAIWRGPRPESRLLVATSRPEERFGEIGAGNETRTRDPDLGKVVLYQLSYSRFGRWILFASALWIKRQFQPPLTHCR